MSDQESHCYLWLKPAEPELSQLRQLIRRLSSVHGTPEFEPHVSLLARLRGSREELMDGLHSLASGTARFPLVFHGIDFRDEYYRCLFLELEQSPMLENLHIRAGHRFPHDESWRFEPHVSLMYGELPVSRKQAIIAELADSWPRTVQAGSLALYLAPGGPAEWYPLQELVLG